MSEKVILLKEEELIESVNLRILDLADSVFQVARDKKRKKLSDDQKETIDLISEECEEDLEDIEKYFNDLEDYDKNTFNVLLSTLSKGEFKLIKLQASNLLSQISFYDIQIEKTLYNLLRYLVTMQDNKAQY